MIVMTSYEPERTRAYSEDLRWRMVWQREVLQHGYDIIGSNLGVDRSTVIRNVALFRATGTVSKKKYPKERAARELTTPAQLFVLNLVVQRPGIYLHEIQEELEASLMVTVSLSTICRFLQTSGFTRQRLCTIALQQDRFLREQFILDISVYSPEMLIFVDETGADRRNSLRKYAYSLRGKPAKNHSLMVRGERVSAIACMSMAGILDVKTLKGTCDGDQFYDFLQRHLIQYTMPYNGVNPHSVVVLDNCAIHHTSEVTSTLTEIGVLVHFLPPYSPDFNLIEEAFSKVKTSLKGDMESAAVDSETLLLANFASITPNDCRGWISHAGIFGN